VGKPKGGELFGLVCLFIYIFRSTGNFLARKASSALPPFLALTVRLPGKSKKGRRFRGQNHDLGAKKKGGQARVSMPILE